MDELERSEVKALLQQNEKLLLNIHEDDNMAEELRMKLRRAMRIQLVVRYAVRLIERAEGELLEELDRIVGEADE